MSRFKQPLLARTYDECAKEPYKKNAVLAGQLRAARFGARLYIEQPREDR